MRQKGVGVIILVLGLFAVMLCMNMETSVETEFGDRVNNIGLMNDKQNYLILSSLIVISGLLIFLLSKDNSSTVNKIQSCSHCKSEIELEDDEIRSQHYVCPECQRKNQIISL